MPNSDSSSNFMPEYKFLGYYNLPNSFYGHLNITRFFKNYMGFPYENKSGETSPKFIFIWRSHIKISENFNFQTAVEIVWQLILTQNFAFTHTFRCRMRIWHPFCSRLNGYHRPRFDVENRLRELNYFFELLQIINAFAFRWD